MSQIISNLDGEINIADNFNRLGVKLIIYGGVLADDCADALRAFFGGLRG